MGKPCRHGHSGKRYVRNCECTECRNEYSKNKRLEAGLKKPGRPKKIKLERKYPKYPKPQNDFDNWILRSKRKNKERRQIAYEDYLNLYRSHCPLLNIELDYKLYDGLTTPSNYATLDKINPNNGYVVGNLQILSHRANTLKNNATLEELKTLIKNMEIK
jgi:hypothetical protein